MHSKFIFYFISIIVLINASPFTTYAGLMEASTTYGTRTSSIDEDNYTKSESWTGSIAWYFLEQSAIELSYTKGLAEQSLRADADPAPTIYYSEFEMYGADLVVTLASKGSFFQPFVRGGMAKLKKKIYREDPSGTITQYGDAVDEVVPSYGAGFKVFLTQTFSLKASYDRWKSGSSADKEIWDEAIKGGVSWFF